ncbi:MAG: glycosyltransferase family 4 protein [Gemmatimonadota bacterium]
MAERVAVLSSNFWPEPTGTGQTMTEFARFLAGQGLDVRVVTALPYYPEWEIRPGYRGRPWRTERSDGLTIYRSWHAVSPRPSTLTRLLHEATLSLFALPNMVRALRGARAAYIASPALSYAFTASLVAALLRVPRVLLVKDLMPEAAIEMGMLTNPVAIGVARALARGVYALAGEIHTLGEGMRRRIVAVTSRPERVRVVPDTIDADELAPVPREENEFRARFVPEGTFAVLHTGNMGRKQDLDLLLRAADRLRGEPDIRFYVFGDGAEKDRFLARREELGLGNVEHHPLQARRLLRHMLSGADAVLISQLPVVVDIVVPSKLLTALAAGAMIVAACHEESETARLIGESGGGVRIPPSDDAALAARILDLRDGRVDVAACRARARAFALERFERGAVYGAVLERAPWAAPRPAPRPDAPEAEAPRAAAPRPDG